MSIKITKTIELEDFEAWSGGADRLEEIKELGILEEAQAEIEAMLEGQEDVTETTINDILWFEMDDFINQHEEEQGEELTEAERTDIIERLDIMRGHGQFEGEPEDTMDFKTLSDDELTYYNDEWIAGQFDE